MGNVYAVNESDIAAIANGFRTARKITDKLTLAQMATLAAEGAGGESIKPIDDVPDYVKTEAQTVANAVKSVQSAKTLTFATMSDTHIAMHSTSANGKNTIASAEMAGQGLAFLRNILPIHAAFVLGDLTASDGAYTVQQVYNDWNGTIDRLSVGFGGLPSAWTAGNHEINYGINRERSMTESEIYAYIGANSKGLIHPDGKCYGYMDFAVPKIRVIVLNTADTLTEKPQSSTSVKADSEFVGAEQLQWLASTALDLSDKANISEWGIIICSHHPLMYGGDDKIGRALAIVEAYKNGESGTITYTSNTSHTVTYDFTQGDKAEIICNFCGHSHNYGYGYMSYSASVDPWLLRICTPCINCGRENEHARVDGMKHLGEFDANGAPKDWTKTPNTEDGTSFCINTIDRENKVIYSHAFGVGPDRTISYAAGAGLKKVTNNLTYCQNSNTLSSVVYGTAYSATITANSGYDLSSVKVTMGGTDITSTAVSGSTISITSVTGDIVITAVAVEQAPAYTNVLKTAGWTDGVRLSSSGTTSNENNHTTTGFISCKVGDTIRFANIEGLTLAGTSNKRISFYDASNNHIAQRSVTSTELGQEDRDGKAGMKTQFGAVYDANGNLSQLTIPASYTPLAEGATTVNLSATTFMRFCTNKGGITDASIVTVNEEIV